MRVPHTAVSRWFFHWSLCDSKSPQVSRTHYYYLLIRVFHTSVCWWSFHWSLRDSKSPQVSRTLLSILAILNNVVVWMVSTHPPTSKSSCPFNNPLVTVPKAPITIGIIVTCMFHSFFNSLARSKYLSFFSHSFSFILWSAGTAKSTILQVVYFYWLLLDLVFRPRLGDPCVCQSPIGVYVCHFLGQVLGCAYTICWYGRIKISCTSLSGSPCPPSCVSPYPPSVQICYFQLLCDWWFHLCHRIDYICYYYYYYYYFTHLRVLH